VWQSLSAGEKPEVGKLPGLSNNKRTESADSDEPKRRGKKKIADESPVNVIIQGSKARSCGIIVSVVSLKIRRHCAGIILKGR